jgi:dihydrofolate reductase
MTSMSEAITGGQTAGLELTEFARRHLGGAVALFAAEGWQTYTTDPERTYCALTAPGCTTLVALDGDTVAGLVQLQSDGEIQAHLSALVVGARWRQRGLGRLPSCGGACPRGRHSHRPAQPRRRLLPRHRRRSHSRIPPSPGDDRIRPLIYSMGVSLDGYIAGPRGEGDWAAPDAELHRFHNEQARELELHLLGSRLYQVMAYWETAEQRNPSAADHELEFARIWERLPKLVYSQSLEAVEGNTRLSRADPAQEVQALKQQDGEPIAVGGATLAASLTAQGLIDEYQLFVSPVVLGGGTPFFAGDTQIELAGPAAVFDEAADRGARS